MANNAASGFVIDVDEGNFANEVLARSRQVPVLVDFWAEWCGPCRILGPILERIAEELNGAFILAKLNTEQSPQLAAQFGIRSIPNVKLFVDGRVVDEFTGALPDAQVREFLRRHVQTETDKMLADAQRLEQEGNSEAARVFYEKVLEAEPANATAHLQLARLLLAQGNEQEAETHLAAIPPSAPEFDAISQLRQVMEFQRVCQTAGGEAACRSRLEGDDADLAARYALACCLTAAGRYQEALEELVEVVRRDKNFEDEAARKAMLAIFTVVGERSDLANEYRRRLASVLY